MIRKMKKKQGQVFRLLIVPKPLFLGAPLLKKCSYNAWVMEECECIAEDSCVRVYLSKVCESRWKVLLRFLKKVALAMFKPAGSAGLTYLYAVWAAERAFIQRGYIAYGGEYIVIPFVFYGIYKGLEEIEKLIREGAIYGKLQDK